MSWWHAISIKVTMVENRPILQFCALLITKKIMILGLFILFMLLSVELYATET